MDFFLHLCAGFVWMSSLDSFMKSRIRSGRADWDGILDSNAEFSFPITTVESPRQQDSTFSGLSNTQPQEGPGAVWDAPRVGDYEHGHASRSRANFNSEKREAIALSLPQASGPHPVPTRMSQDSQEVFSICDASDTIASKSSDAASEKDWKNIQQGTHRTVSVISTGDGYDREYEEKLIYAITRPREKRWKHHTRVVIVILCLLVAAAIGTALGVSLGKLSDNDGLDGYVKHGASSKREAQGNRLVVFGASWCDNGHTRAKKYSKSLRKSPYVGGRSSNGPVWVEYLEKSFQSQFGDASLVDYAYSGAMASNNEGAAAVPDGPAQISSYTDDLQSESKFETLGSNGRTLVAVHIGLNQITSQFSGVVRSAKNGAAVTQDVLEPHYEALRRSVHDLMAAITSARSTLDSRLSTQGRHDWFIVPIPPVHILPLIHQWTNDNATLINAADQMTNVFNNELITQAALLPNMTSGDVFVLNCDSFFENAYETPKTVGASRVSTSCVVGNQACNETSNYVFWDSEHLTTAMHKQWAEYVTPTLVNFWNSQL